MKSNKAVNEFIAIYDSDIDQAIVKFTNGEYLQPDGKQFTLLIIRSGATHGLCKSLEKKVIAI